MKMSEVFKMPIEYKGTYFGEKNGNPVGDSSNYNRDAASAHAINMHDELVEALEAAMFYAVEFQLELDSPQSQIDAWKVLSPLKPFELLKRAKG